MTPTCNTLRVLEGSRPARLTRPRLRRKARACVTGMFVGLRPGGADYSNDLFLSHGRLDIGKGEEDAMILVSGTLAVAAASNRLRP